MNAKKKGNAGEHKFANFLQSHGIKAYKNSSSGGNIWKSDIHNNINANFEVKTCKKINLKECWKQTDRDSSLSKTTPYLAIHFDGMPDGEWLMVMHSEDWVDMLKKSLEEKEVIEIPQEDSRDKKWAIENLRLAVQKALKHL